MVIETNVLAGPSAQRITVTEPGRPKTKPPTGLFPMSGDKTTLLENPVLAEPLRAAMKAPNYKRFIDAFTGTTSIAMWVAKEGNLPPGSILNELSKLRSIDIRQSIHNRDKVNEQLRLHGDAIRQLCFKKLSNMDAYAKDVPVKTLEDWEAKEGTKLGSSQHTLCHEAVKHYLMQELAKQWSDTEDAPKDTPATAALHRLFSYNMFRPGTPVGFHQSDVSKNQYKNLVCESSAFQFQMLGNENELDAGQGRIRVKECIEEMESSNRKVSSSLQGTTIEARNGWEYIELIYGVRLD
jgi:hypothetical protein